ncbi:DKNYY domain-containing protein [Olleya sp. Bg11-27]|uniref:DKNYY domain-containing protein n=1 Tax=Olleya sp. Bg11-27 TaxID=2058135 RepID=UPI000C31581C|nr:DKNYY domain-containing protein [Olleya sp. Bg11-27]AUC76402.1 hypothetical protein CW732_12290 [Olleya sp. Bg11-27]
MSNTKFYFTNNYGLFLIVLITILLGCKKTPDQNQNLLAPKVLIDTITAKDTTSKADTITDNRTEHASQLISRIDSINKLLNWKKTKSVLWTSKNGDLAFKTFGGIQEFITAVYIKTLSEGKPLADVIDLNTFKHLGSAFYKDKNNIYTFYEMAGGGRVWILKDADLKTFRTIGECYAKDKNYIYGERAMKMDAVDYKTFKTCKSCGCYAKDENGYYYWGNKIEDINTITNKETLAIIKKLN